VQSVQAYNLGMRVREAKDFLVSEIKQQAERENIPLENLEIRMLYFTEQCGSSKDMQELAEELDHKYDMSAYEKKIACLMKRAYKRLKSRHSPDKETWDAAIRVLRKGDHYILVMWGGISPLTFLILLALILFALSALIVINWVAKSFRPPDARTLQIAFVTCIVLGYLLRRRLAETVNFLVDRTVTRWIKSGSKNEEL